MDKNNEIWRGELIDAYAHIGNPRFGSLENFELYLDGLSIQQAMMVLGPGLPDYKTIDSAIRKYGDKLRCVGIPFGESEKQRREFADIQIEMGISGMRFMPFEVEANREIVHRIGEEGLCLFAINPYHSTETINTLLTWLEKYPRGKVISPHFLLPDSIDQRLNDPMLFRSLLKHPNFHAILSRHGGVESKENYPHRDLKKWVEEVVELVTWKRLMWGGEFPIFFERGETPENVRDWILKLGIPMEQEDKEDFYSNNARRLFFTSEMFKYETIDLPEWVVEQQQQLKVKVFTTNPMEMDMKDYDRLLADFLITRKKDKQLDFYDYLTGKLSLIANSLKQERENK